MALKVVRAAGHVRDRLRRFVADAPPGRGPVRLVGLVALAAGVVFVLGSALWVAGRTAATVVALQQAQGQLEQFRYRLSASQTPSSTALQESVQARTDFAAGAAGDPLWRAAEGVPGIGPNLRALRETSQVLDGLVVAAKPLAMAAEGLSLNSLKPSSGIDIEPLKRMPEPMKALNAALIAGSADADRIDTDGVAGPLADRVVQLRQGLATAKPISAQVTKVLPIAYSALGGTGRRYYLLMFQNNAEERASGGNPAVIAMLKVYKGRLTLDQQLNSSEFPGPYPEPVRTFGAQFQKIYGQHVETYVQNTTFTPDFPTTARLVRTMWQRQAGTPVDGVISFDPVALSYLLRATGPIELKGGDVLTADNAVDYLLSGVYAKYANVKVQNQVFASAAASIFSAVTHAQGGIQAYLDQLPQMLDEQRLKAWSVRESEQTLLMDSPLGTMLPATNDPKTVLGVYNNDDATSKMSYYMDDTIRVDADTCRPTPRWTVTTDVTNTLTKAQAKRTSDFVLAHQKRIPFGGDRQWVQLYGPVGSKLVDMFIDGKKVVWGTDIEHRLNTNPDATGVDDFRPAVRGVLYGRPVGTVSIIIPATETVRVSGTFSGGTDPSKTVGVSHTPRVREVPVTIAERRCG
ncbi:DUF4012 domain-containing protein [Amnibacterium endophyticum]|uniref:DUF4012 domain-containing protein n=1 Tax=Amnibacterium endophyticum TaxID=2109337 RepID=A0ABW4LEK8_9MICO